MSFQKPKTLMVFTFDHAAHFVEPRINETTGAVEYLDGWPVGTRWRYPQPRTIEKRFEHAREFRCVFVCLCVADFVCCLTLFILCSQRFSFPLEMEFVCDTIDNSFNRQYAAWPDSVYLISEGKLVYRSQLEEEGSRGLFLGCD
jgi:hypothetical protein